MTIQRLENRKPFNVYRKSIEARSVGPRINAQLYANVFNAIDSTDDHDVRSEESQRESVILNSVYVR